MRRLLAAILVFASCVPANAAPVTAEEIAQRIAATMAEKLPSAGRYRVALADPLFQLVLPDAAQGRYDIAALTFDAGRSSFAATLGFTGASGREYARIGGRAEAVIAVPVLSRDVAAGETVTEGDLSTMEVPAARTSSTLLTSAAAVAGQAARRPLRAQTPLFAFDLRKPVVVKKNELVTVRFAAGGIELTAQGQVQTDAGKGDTVQVLNTRSRRMIEARVVGAGLVEVTAPDAALAAR
jgi:flagella basal body P-ring formation protein FlgA